MIRKITFFLFFALTLILFIVSCERDTTPSANEINPSGETIKDEFQHPKGIHGSKKMTIVLVNS